MKTFIIVIGLLALSLPSQGNVRPYLQTLVKDHGFAKLAATPPWRRYFPNSGLFNGEKELSTEKVPPIGDFMNEQLGKDGMKELEELDEEEFSQRIGELHKNWFEKFYPEATDEQVLEVLSEDAELRAHMLSYYMTINTSLQQGLQMSLQDVFTISFGLAMFIRAIDREDLELTELQNTLNKFMQNNILEFVYVGNGDTPHVPGRVKVFYAGREDYLLRANHVKHPAMSGEEQSKWWGRGYTDKEFNDIVPPLVVNMVLAQNVLPDENGLLAGYEPKVYFDLLSEPGIVGDFIPTVNEIEASPDLQDAIVTELNMDRDAFEAFTLTDKSLLQEVQLRRLGFSTEEIKELTYATSEAIIVSGHYSREAFVEQHGADIAALNEIVEAKGELVFFLLQQGYADNIDDINPHHVPSHEVIQKENNENRMWTMLMDPGGKFLRVRQQQ